MAIEIQSEVLPKSNKGRKPVELNQELIDGLTKLLLESPPVEQDDYLTPQAFGPPWEYEKEHQATAKGRKYADAIKARIGKKVSVRPTPIETTVKGKKVTVYRFRLYIPLSEWKVETEETPEGESDS